MTRTLRESEAWFNKAHADLEMARRAMEPSAPFPDMACFHAQQCAEKCLKGHLAARQVSFQRVHDLTYLTQLCFGVDSTFKDLMPAVDVLGEYASKVRYPLDQDREPSAQEAFEAIELAERISSFIDRALGRG